ncbi:MAG TPA: copper chaperone PCu(A)C [Rhodopila sp.]|jgi:copper(I)-binding protein|nr:copper chaperone PCu(A)C [Rhodopila sp.]
MTSRSRLGSGFLQRAGRGASTLLVGFLSVQVAQGAVTLPDVAVTGGQMRVLLPSRPAAGYFTLENRGGSALVLTGASAPDCQSLMLHQSTEDGGMARMAMVTAVPVPPHGTLRFAPGGYHLMCMQPSGALLTHAGSETVTLHFADGGSVSAPFAIQGIGH